MSVETHQILFSDSVYRSEDGKYALIGLFTGISASAFPTGLPQVVFFTSVRGFGKEAKLEFVVVQPDGTEIVRGSVTSSAAQQIDQEAHQFYVTVRNLPLNEPGPYRVMFLDGDKRVAERTLLVTRIAPSGSTP